MTLNVSYIVFYLYFHKDKVKKLKINFLKKAEYFEMIVSLACHFHPPVRGQDRHHCYHGLLASMFDLN